MSDQDEIVLKVAHMRELRKQLKAAEAELAVGAVARMVENACLIDAFKEPSPARVAGALLHAAQCSDVAGSRLRDALVDSFGFADLATDPSDAKPLPLLLYLGREPDETDAQVIEKLNLEPVFKRGRRRPCTMYSGEAMPELLAPFVRRYGGDCYVMRPPKRRAGRDSGA